MNNNLYGEYRYWSKRGNLLSHVFHKNYSRHGNYKNGIVMDNCVVIDFMIMEYWKEIIKGGTAMENYTTTRSI